MVLVRVGLIKPKWDSADYKLYHPSSVPAGAVESEREAPRAKDKPRSPWHCMARRELLGRDPAGPLAPPEGHWSPYSTAHIFGGMERELQYIPHMPGTQVGLCSMRSYVR